MSFSDQLLRKRPGVHTIQNCRSGNLRKDGEAKSAWTTFGTAFANGSGNIILDLPQHVAVSGRVVLFPKDDHTPNQ
ncbi:MAG: hypothetical protein KIT39_21010 [Nitrospirales bacterium]|nr:hypothetical protein [Nitrospirales bacterium]